MHVAVDAYHAMRSYGGIARYIRSLVCGMAEQAPDDCFVLFVNHFRQDGTMWRPEAANVEAAVLNAPRRLMQFLWDGFSWPPAEYWTGKIDVFHGTHFVLPAMRHARSVLTVHDLTWLRHPEYFMDTRLNERGYRKELPQALQRADAVIAVSVNTKRDLMELMHISEEKIHVIHEGVEEHFFIGNDGNRLAQVMQYNGLQQPYLVFLAGTPEPRKNIERTVAAARVAAPQMPLVIIGPNDPIRTLVGDASSENVHVLENVPDDDLPWLLHGAEIALYPSLYEGFGLPVPEAMAAGTAVITSNISACSEIAGDAALTVDPHSRDEIIQAIRTLLDDENSREAYASRGRQRAASFNWKVVAESTLRLYRSLV